MKRPQVRVPGIVRFPLAVAVLLGALAASAHAQGTDEQREACAPDAVRLCQDTIPDIPKTTACMKAHEAELSPHCRQVFEAATGAPPAPAADAPDAEPPPRIRKRRVAREPIYPEDDPPMERHYRYRSPDSDEELDSGDIQHARRVIARLCEDDMIDPRTCAITERALAGRR